MEENYVEPGGNKNEGFLKINHTILFEIVNNINSLPTAKLYLIFCKILNIQKIKNKENVTITDKELLDLLQGKNNEKTVSRNSFKKARKTLEELGIIKIISKKGRNITYEINIDRGKDLKKNGQEQMEKIYKIVKNG